MMTWFGWLDSYAALIILFAFKTYGIFLVKQYMESVPDYFVNAGRVDGASKTKAPRQSEYTKYSSLLRLEIQPVLPNLPINMIGSRNLE